MPTPELLISSVGTEIYYGSNLTLDKSWQKHINFRWEPKRIHELLDGIEGLYLQAPHEQSEFKISYRVDFDVAPSVRSLRRILRENKVRAKVILSLGMFLDIIPTRAGSGVSIRHVAMKWGLPFEQILVAGDSGNDEAMLAGNTLGVVVGNYSQELEKLRKYLRVFFAPGHHANGIIDGIHHYRFLDTIEIPAENPLDVQAESLVEEYA